jgi:hypothetical protein
MPTADFTSPIYREEETTETPSLSSADSAALDQDSGAVDLNDPALLMQEVTGADSSVNPYAAPPPPPDGFYRAKLKQVDVKDSKGQPARFVIKQEMDYSKKPYAPVFLPSGQPKSYVSTKIEARIQDLNGKFDNIPVFDQFMDTRVDRNGGCPVLFLLQALKVKLPAKPTQKVLIDSLLSALAGEPEVDIKETWVGQLSKDDSDAIKAAGKKVPKIEGMHRFPQHDGKPQPEMQVKVEGVGEFTVRAQATIKGYFPAGSQTKKK